MSAPTIDQRWGYLAALGAVSIATGFMLLSRMGGKSVLTEWDVFALRLATASIFLLPFAWRLPSGSWCDPRLWLLAMIGGVGYGVLAYAGFKFAPAAHAGILITGMQPFMIALAAWWLMGERPERHRWIGYALIASGVLLAAAPLLMEGWNPSQLLGDGMFLAASALWALYSVLVKRWSYSPWTLTCFVALASAAVWLPVYVLLLPKQLTAAPVSMLLIQGLYQGVAPSIIAMMFYLNAVRLIGPSRTGAIMALVPVLTGLLAVPVLDEPLSGWLLVALFLVTAGAILAVREARGDVPARDVIRSGR